MHDFYFLSICRAYCSSSNLTLTTCNLSNQERVMIYGGIIAGMFVLNIARAVLFYIVLLRAAHVLHNRMFQKLLRVPVLFFDSNPVGTSSLSFDVLIISVINLMCYWDNHYHSQGVCWTVLLMIQISWIICCPLYSWIFRRYLNIWITVCTHIRLDGFCRWYTLTLYIYFSIWIS